MEEQTGATALQAQAVGGAGGAGAGTGGGAAAVAGGGAGSAPVDAATAAGGSVDPSLVDPSLADPSLAAPPAGGLEATLRHGWEILLAGGPVVAILIGLSVIALAIVLVKLWQFRAARLGDRRSARQAVSLYRAGRGAEALALAGRSRNPVARVLVRAINGKARRDLPEAMVREEVVRYGADQLESLRGWFRPLEVIGSLAPLLGLFGTVLGMISAFQQLEEAGSQVDPSILSGGIWEALLTTAVGLAVAMPVIVLLNWLERRVDRLAHEMDDCVTQVFTEDLSFAPVAEERSHGGLDGRTAALVAGR